jgi:hypothetical protein
MTMPGMTLVIALALTGCGSETPLSPEPTAGGGDGSPSSNQATAAEVELHFDETTEHQDLKLRWLELDDSRCPIGVVCIWAGQTVVTLEVVRGEDGPAELELLRRAGREPETAKVFDHELRLLEVEPHPKEGITPNRSQYVLRIEIAEP